MGLTATRPDKQLTFNLRAAQLTPGPNSQYPAPSFGMFERESKELLYTVKDADGVAVNISTYTTIVAGFYPTNSSTAEFTKTGVLVTGGTTGQFTLTLDPADTDGLQGVYDIECQVTGTGIKFTLFRANVNVVKSYIS